jgi:hypothetical protein
MAPTLVAVPQKTPHVIHLLLSALLVQIGKHDIAYLQTSLHFSKDHPVNKNKTWNCVNVSTEMKHNVYPLQFYIEA